VSENTICIVILKRGNLQSAVIEKNTKSQMRYTFLNRRPQLYNSVLRMINYNEYISDMKFVSSVKTIMPKKVVNIRFQNPDKALTELCIIIT
jgi:hypothetical protein